MHQIIEEELEKICKSNNLSDSTTRAIKKLLVRKLSGDFSSGTDFANDLSRVYDLIKEDI